MATTKTTPAAGKTTSTTAGKAATKTEPAPTPRSPKTSPVPAVKTTTTPTAKTSGTKTGATVRTYRHGLGDCHLITLTRGAKKFRILIDCGVILGTPDASAAMTAVMNDVLQESGSHVDILAVTHEHWDHVSGFVQAQEAFAKLKVDQVWMAWTENPKDKTAQELNKSRDNAIALLNGAALRMQMQGMSEPTVLSSMQEFFGAAGQGTTKAALELARAKVAADKVRYCDQTDAPVDLPGFGARIYTLGPPRDMALLKKILPSATNPETYQMAMGAFEATIAAALTGDEAQQPFPASCRIPTQVAQSLPFFQAHYWNDDDWRRIDVAWLDEASSLALDLDSKTNNTSLVLAIEVDGLGVLLFAADAQVGNWLSWPACQWKVGDRAVTGTDLLNRTVLYKVGHHGSHNATLKAGGLELMKALSVAVIPVDHEMALKKKWGNIPLAGLTTALDAATSKSGYVLRTDKEPSADAVKRGARATKLYFEVDL